MTFSNHTAAVAMDLDRDLKTLTHYSEQDTLEKLKILEYDTEFAVPEMEGKLIHQVFFAVPHKMLNEQFYYFTSLFTWLMRINGFNFRRPGQFDDPNTTTANIMEALRHSRVTIDYPMQKLKQGYGEAVCVLLNLLCDKALEAKGFRMGQPKYKEDSYPEEAPVDEDEEVNADIADDVAANEDDDEDDVYVAPEKKQDVRETKTIESSTDPAQWKVEVENVAPLLKMRIEADNKEWRTHLEQTKELGDNIQEKVPNTKDNLVKLAAQINTAIESISTREKYINSQYKDLVQEYHEVQKQLTVVTTRYDERNREVSELTNELTTISETLETIRTQMEERGDSMTDTGPLVKMKDAMKKVKKDIKEMDLRIGTVSHNLLHIRMQQEAMKGEPTMKREEEEED
eukprot:CAMPEP_0184321250 /NCGR_PEP_ID=MMETSP1049-20130417/118007_1 /TAXON_ID=77928 /ORGANISM="Proteomonas sulcata, Strain CCMP704" /LENGTH=399 /DNA_ID=CAMNT_0026641981 /DNA_START=52 /DNA_END=1252 /DNA_ORIENTATION=-